MSLLGLANQTLTTPALMEFATHFKDQIPEDVCLYIQEMFERNVARNDRLAAQLTETVADTRTAKGRRNACNGRSPALGLKTHVGPRHHGIARSNRGDFRCSLRFGL
jgi:hypothetical protein